MNKTIVNRSNSALLNPRRQQALTLVELMISMSILGLVVAGFIALQLFGMKQNQIVESKLGANDQSRKLLEKCTKY